MMLELAAEQTTEITTELIDREFLPTATNQGRGVQNLEFVLQKMHKALVALIMRRRILLPTRGRTHWRHGGGCRRDMTRQQEEGNETFCERSFLRDGALFWNSKQGLNAGCVSRFEKKLKDKMDYEINNSNRLRTFEDARLEIVTYVEAKFGLRVRDSKPSDTGSREHSDHMRSTLSLSLSSGKGKGSSGPRDGCFQCGGAHFQRDCNASKNAGPRVKAKERVKRTMENQKGSPKDPKVPKAHARVKHRKLVSQVLKTRNQRQARKLRNQSKWDMFVPLTRCGFMLNGVLMSGSAIGVWMNGMMIGVLLDGMNVGNKRMTHLQALFHLKVWISVPRAVRRDSNG